MDTLSRSARVVVLTMALCALAAFGMFAIPERRDVANNEAVVETESSGPITSDPAQPDGDEDTVRDEMRLRISKEQQGGNERGDGELPQTDEAPALNSSEMESGLVSVPNGAEVTSQSVDQSAEEIVRSGVTDEIRRALLELPEFSVPVAEDEDGTDQLSRPSSESKSGDQKSGTVARNPVKNNSAGEEESGRSGNDVSNDDDGDNIAVDTDRLPIESPEFP